MNNLMSADQVAEKLSVSVRTVYNLMKYEGLASIAIGRCRKISEEDLQKFVESKRVGGNNVCQLEPKKSKAKKRGVGSPNHVSALTVLEKLS